MHGESGLEEFSPFRLIIAALALVISSALGAAPISKNQFTVTDGDTIHVKGEVNGTRLVGFNAPETREAQCHRDKATARLNQLVAGGKLELTKVACSCVPGTKGTMICNYARSCGTLRVNGRDVGDILIAEGLAVPFVCEATSCPTTPRPWCER